MARTAATKTARERRAENRDKAIASAKKSHKSATKPVSDKIVKLRKEIAELKSQTGAADLALENAVAGAWSVFHRECNKEQSESESVDNAIKDAESTVSDAPKVAA